MSDQPPSMAASSDGGGFEAAPGVFITESDMRFTFVRSSGPGGQNVNKLNTKAELWVPLSAIRGLHPEALQRLIHLGGKRITRENELHLTAETARTQEGNRAVVLEKLRQLLEKAKHRPRPRRATRPSRASKQRRLEQKKRRSEIKAGRRGGGE